MEEQISLKSIEATLQGKIAFCKFLSANDSGETGGHQSGILISKSARSMFFLEQELRENHIRKEDVHVRWQNDFYTDSCITWYKSKGELRITKFGRGFPFLRSEYTGALFVLIKNTTEEYDGFILNTEDDIQQYLDAFGLTPAETNRPIEINRITPKKREKTEIDKFISSLNEEFPSSEKMSHAARIIDNVIRLNSGLIISNPDQLLLSWTEEEYRLFRALEQVRYGNKINVGFKSVDDFITLANQVLNRRKSRAGKSLENHLAAIFDGNNIRYTAQGTTEGKKKPDFIFPSAEDYHNMEFSVEKLCVLAAKTTCKDRWRQILSEADRLRDQNKYLCTLQQGISSAQMDEMQAEGVVLVVPEKYISTYPKDKRDRIWTIYQFVQYVKEIEQN